MKTTLLLLFTLLLSQLSIFSQGANCLGADPFCTGTTYSFPNNTGTTAQAGPNYGCLSTQPNPAWYYLQIDQSGNLDIGISQVNGNGSGIDVDFICWGPFVSPTLPCTALLTSLNTEDCSYSPSATETANITGAISGEYYILLITNFSNQTGNITFSQTGGSGSTDCSIVSPSCPTVGFHAEDGSGNSFNLPINIACTTDSWVFLRADDAATAGGAITPTVTVNVTTNARTTGNNIFGYENNGGTWNSYWGATNIPANTNYSFTMFEMDNVTATSFGIEICDVSSGANMSYTIEDAHCGGTIATGTWTAADGSNSGAAGPVGNPTGTGCQFITFPTSAVTGIASYSCPTCPAGSFVGTDYGFAYFNPAQAGPGSYPITYSFDDECGCSNSSTETIVVTNPFDATFSYANANYCQSASDPTPTVTQTGGTFTSSPAGLSINSTTGAIDLSASTAQSYTITHTVGAGATDYSGACNDVETFAITIDAPPVANAGADFTITCVSNVGGAAIGTGNTAGLTYSWSPATGLSSSSTSNPSANPSATTTYTVTTSVTANPACQSTDAVTVTVNNTLPTANAGSDLNLNCTTPSGNFTATGGGTYSWNTPSGVVSGATVGATTASTPGTYTVTVTAANGCTATDNATLAVDITTPTANAGSDLILDCNTTSGSFVATGGGTYSWNTPSGVVSGSTVNVTNASTAGNFTVTVTGTNGCTSTDAATLITNTTPPTANAGSDFTTTCTTPTTTLTASGGGTYAWSPLTGLTGSGASVTADPATTTTYTVTVTGANGCTATDNVTVTVDETVPVASAGSDITLDCNLSSSNFTATGGGTYSWNTPSGVVAGATVNVTTASTVGTYTVTVTGTNGCTATDAATLSIDLTTPTATIAAPNMIDCVTPSTTVDGSGSLNSGGNTTGLTYAWVASSGGVISGSLTGSSITATAAGDYTLTVTQSNGCTDVEVVTVTADASVPSAVISGNNPLTCDSTSITLLGTGSTGGTLTYEWQDNSSTQIGTNSTVTISTAGTYTLIVTNTSNSCTNTASVIVSQNTTLPTISVTTPLVVDCNNAVVTLDGTGSSTGANFTYAWTNSTTGVVIGSGSAITDSTSTADTYVLTIENTTTGCTNTANVVVTEDLTDPVADAGIDVNFPCGVLTVPLDGSNSTGTGITYSWSGPGTITNGTTNAPDVSAAGNYILTVTGSNGCSATDNVDVIPDSNAPVADAGSDISVTCLDLPWPIALDGSGSDSGPNITYSWAVTSGTGTITNGTSTTPDVSDEGSYTLTVTNTTNSCTASSTVNVTTDTVSPIADAGLDTEISCNSSLIQNLDATNSTGTNLTYNWSTLNGTIDSQSNGGAVVSAGGDYEVIVTGDNGCTDTDIVTITMDTVSPVAAIAPPLDLPCDGSSITLDGTNSTGSNITYTWPDNSTNSTVAVTTAGSYTLTVTSDNGCTNTATVNVSGSAGPVADFTATSTSGDIPLVVDYTDNSTGSNITYSWDFGDGNTSTSQDPSNTFITVGSFTTVLTVTDDQGCSDTASIVIATEGESYLIIPNIFSPNGDGVNDVFNLQGSNITELIGVVLNRWGQVVFEWSALEAGWDGRTMSGMEASEGTYFYIIDAVGADGKVYNFQGAIEMLR